MVSLTVPSPPMAQTRSKPLLHGLAREARGVAHALGLALVDVVAEAAQGVDDQRQVAVVGAAARVRVVDRHEMPADVGQHQSGSGRPPAKRRVAA